MLASKQKVQVTPTLLPTPLPPVTLDLSGKIDQKGQLLEDIELISIDGCAVLSLKQGTTLKKKDGQPPSSLMVTGRPQSEYFQYGIVTGLIYDFGPEEVTMDKPSDLQLCLVLPPAEVTSIKPDEPLITALFPGKKETWMRFTTEFDIDWEASKITAKINQMGAYAVTFWYWYVPPTS